MPIRPQPVVRVRYVIILSGRVITVGVILIVPRVFPASSSAFNAAIKKARFQSGFFLFRDLLLTQFFRWQGLAISIENMPIVL